MEILKIFNNPQPSFNIRHILHDFFSNFKNKSSRIAISVPILIFFGFLFQKIFISGPGLKVAADYQHNELSIALFNLFLAIVFFVGTPLFIHFLQRLSWQTGLFVIILFFLIFSFVAIITVPTQSQDAHLYLLLGRIFSVYDQNPYQTPPLAFSHDPWCSYILNWLWQPMIYGPLWALITGFIALMTTSLATAFMYLKLLYLFILILSGFIFWKIMEKHEFSLERRTATLSLLALNPLLIQQILVDAHNDVFLLFGILISYYFLLHQRYIASGISLLIVGFIKFIPLFLLPVVIFTAIREHGFTRRTLTVFLSLLCFEISFLFLFTEPFGFSLEDLVESLRRTYSVTAALPNAALPGSLILFSIFGTQAVGVMGSILAFFGMYFASFRRSLIEAYLLPIAIILLCATLWFQVWYLLWIFPLAALYLPQRWFLGLTVFGLICGIFFIPAVAFILIIALLSLRWFYNTLKYLLKLD